MEQPVFMCFPPKQSGCRLHVYWEWPGVVLTPEQRCQLASVKPIPRIMSTVYKGLNSSALEHPLAGFLLCL